MLFDGATPPSLQKLIFLDTAEGVASTLRPYWAEATADRASVVQAVPDMLEIVPPGTSKGSGVRILLDHLGATPDEVCLSTLKTDIFDWFKVSEIPLYASSLSTCNMLNSLCGNMSRLYIQQFSFLAIRSWPSGMGKTTWRCSSWLL